jgi:hypothetical protein
MADETREKLDQIEKATEDLSRSFSKIKKEIAGAAKETSIWLDATKAVQAAQNGINSTSKIVADLGKQHSANIKERSRLQYEELGGLDKAKTLLETRKAQNDALIASTTALLSVSAAGSIDAINAQQKLNELTGISHALETDLTENRERYSDVVLNIIPALDSANAKLRDQVKIAAQINREEKARKELAEKMVKINESLIKPLIGDSKEYAKIVEFATGILKRGAAAFLAMITASVDRFKELDKAAGDFRDKTGFLVSQTERIDKAAREVNVEFSHLGVTIDKAYESAGALTGEFQVIGLVTKDMISSTAQMAANLGISASDAAKFRASFTSIAEASGTTAEGTILAASALAKMGGVAPSAVMKDMAEASADTLAFLAKSPLALIKATVEARRLGTTVNALSKSAREFLNYQESITSELEASALLGMALNFQESRLLAYQGKVVASREAALRQIQKVGDFTRLSVYEQEALAKAAGMTVGEVIKQQNQQKMLAALENSANEEERKMFSEYKAMQRQMAEDEKRAEENLVARGKDMVKMQLRQREINKLTDALASIWIDISDTLLPIANAIVPFIVTTFRTLAGIVKITGAALKLITVPLESILSLLKAIPIETAFTWMNDAVKELTKTIESVYKDNPYLKWAVAIVFGSTIVIFSLTKLIKTFTILRAAISATGGLWSKIAGLFSRTPSAAGVGGGLGGIGKSISNFFRLITWEAIKKMAALSATLVVFSGGMYALGKALATFNDVDWPSLGKAGSVIVGLVGGLYAASKFKIEWKDMAKLGFALVGLAGGLYLLGKSLVVFNDVQSIEKAGAALAGLMVLGAIAGYFKPVALGMVAVGGAAALLGVGLLAAGKGFEFFGKGISKIIDSIKAVIKITPAFVSGLVKPLKDLADIGFIKLSGTAAGITAIGFAMAGFAVSSAFASFINFFSGDGVIKNILALSSAADGLKRVSVETDNIASKYKSLSAQISEVGGFKQVSEEIDNIISKYKSLSTHMSEKIKASVELMATTTIEVKNLNDLKETIDRLVNAINSLGGAAGAGTQIVNVNNNSAAMVAKLDELISLMKQGYIVATVDLDKMSGAIAKKAGT